MLNKLTSAAALLAAISGIGGGFYAWGEFQTRLTAIESKEYVVNETADFTVVYERVADIEAELGILNAKVEFIDAKIEQMKAEAANPFNQ